MATEKKAEEAATLKQVEERIGQQFQMNFHASEQGMHFIVGTGAFKQEIFTVPPQAMTAAAKVWAMFLKQQQDVQRAVQDVKRNPRGPLIMQH